MGLVGFAPVWSGLVGMMQPAQVAQSRLSGKGQTVSYLHGHPTRGPDFASTQIERHIKVRGQAHPYDPCYTEYFEQRRCFIGRVLWGGRKPSPASTAP